MGSVRTSRKARRIAAANRNQPRFFIGSREIREGDEIAHFTGARFMFLNLRRESEKAPWRVVASRPCEGEPDEIHLFWPYAELGGRIEK